MKKFASLIIALCMLLSFNCISYATEEVASGTCGENLTWTLDTDGTLTISGEGEMTDWNYLSNAPWYIYREK